MNSKANIARSMIKDFVTKVNPYIAQILDAELEDADNYTELTKSYLTELKGVAMAGGKRLRPSFVYYTYKMSGGRDEEEILRVAAAVELMHVFLLVEDDFTDLSPERRGYPTIHETFKKYHQDHGLKGDAKHFGDNLAVYTGLICDHIASNVINNSSFDRVLIQKALHRLNRQIIVTGHGQIHDVYNEVKGTVSEQDVMNVLYWKTGVYTYDNPIHIGAILAGASADDLKKLSEYAVPGGVAFQIQDDILGSFGEEETTGKSAADDIKEGKQTLLAYIAYKNGNAEDKKILDSVLGNRQASDAEVEQVREIMSKTGAVEYSKQKALELVTEAKTALLRNKELVKWSEEGVDYLEGIADYMIERDL